MSGKRAPIIIRMRFNKESGRIEELSVDDGSPLAPEAYHDDVARTIADRLELGAEIVDAFLADAAVHEVESSEEEANEAKLSETQSSEG